MMEKKLSIALGFLNDGQSFVVDGLRLSLDNFKNLVVTGWSQYLNFENITRYGSLQELKQIKSLFNEMVISSEDLRKFVSKREVEFVLSFDDYGKASIDICSEKNGIVEWRIQVE